MPSQVVLVAPSIQGFQVLRRQSAKTRGASTLGHASIGRTHGSDRRFYLRHAPPPNGLDPNVTAPDLQQLKNLNEEPYP